MSKYNLIDIYEGMSDKEFSAAEEAGRLEKHPEKDKIQKIKDLMGKEDQKEDQLKTAYSTLDKAEQDGDIRKQELALAAIDLIKGDLKEDNIKEMTGETFNRIDGLTNQNLKAQFLDKFSEIYEDMLEAGDMFDVSDVIDYLCTEMQAYAVDTKIDAGGMMEEINKIKSVGLMQENARLASLWTKMDKDRKKELFPKLFNKKISQLRNHELSQVTSILKKNKLMKEEEMISKDRYDKLLDGAASRYEELENQFIKFIQDNYDKDFDMEDFKDFQGNISLEESNKAKSVNLREEIGPTGIAISQNQLDNLKKFGAIPGLEVTVQDKDGSNVRKVDYTLTNTDFEKGDDDYDYLEEGLKEHFGRFMKDYQ